MKHSVSTPSAEGVRKRSPAFGAIADMENDVRTTYDLSFALVLMTHGLGRTAYGDEEEGNALIRVSYILFDHAKAVRDQWEAAFEAGKGGAA